MWQREQFGNSSIATIPLKHGVRVRVRVRLNVDVTGRKVESNGLARSRGVFIYPLLLCVVLYLVFAFAIVLACGT